MTHNKEFSQAFTTPQLITDTGTVYLTPSTDKVYGCRGDITFDVTATKATGTFGVNATLQRSADGTNWTDVGTAVALADTVTKLIQSSTTLTTFSMPGFYYRLKVTGDNTQTTNVVGHYIRKDIGE